MANRYFEPGAQRAAKVNDLFTAIAPRYDLVNDLQSFGLHRYWKRRLLRLAQVEPGQRSLDLCCGTGDLAFAFARRGAHAVGLDFSLAMLRVALTRRDTRARRVSKPRAGAASGIPAPRLPAFLRGDALRIPFPENTFDAVTIGYGLRNLADFSGGLREMWRVAKPGGRILVLDFGKPDNRVWRSLYFVYLRRLVPIFGRLFGGDEAAYGYILESLQAYPAQRGLAAEMRALKCAKIRIINLLGGMMSINYGEKRQ